MASRTSLAFFGLLALAAGPARADITMKTPTVDEMKVVRLAYGAFLDANPGVKVETATVDLEGKGIGSVVARFVSKDTCGGANSCATSVIQYADGRWEVVFSHSAKTINLAQAYSGIGGDGMATLVVDGSVRWVSTGMRSYGPDLKSLGDPFPAWSPASPDVAAAAKAELSADLAGIPEPFEFRQMRLQIDAATTAVSAVMVSAYAPGLCSNFDGCPAVLLTRENGKLRTVWSGLAPGPGAVMQTSSRGFKDFALGVMAGYITYRFDGRSYVPLETSFPSQTTPVP